jgi:serine/threonine-protein kinase
MTLPAGTHLGQYEIAAALGAGGMGEVYRTRDTRLGRDVALKTLPESFAHDPERVARFKREAQVLASLNHPHIGAIYGLEEAGGTLFLVLELVDGGTLADRIAALRAKGERMPLAEAVAIARQIADALEAAHEKGIIHRDLKPANNALDASDSVKVLDFGLAKALDAAASGIDAGGVTHSPTLTIHATQAGVILGTAAYMSPEQAKGRAADKRSDVWSFGCVLFEMLAGVRPFEGEDVSDTLATILKSDPDWTRLPAAIPGSIRTLLARCLEKDRKQRIADIAVVRYVLDGPLGPSGSSSTSAEVPVNARRSWRGPVAAFAAVVAAASAGWQLKPVPAASPRVSTRFSVALGQDQTFTQLGRHVVALSPDGTKLAYVANNQIYLRAMDQLDAVPIRGTSETPAEPFFSPDGQWIAYFAVGHLKKIPIGGGSPVTLCTVGNSVGNAFGASWSGDRILFGEGAEGIFEVPATGGTPRLLITADAAKTEMLHGPQVLPGGDAVLFTVGTARSFVDQWNTAQIVVQSLKSGRRKTLVSGGTDGRYLPTGHIVYARDGVLFANAFDADRLELRGGPTAMIQDLAIAGANATGAVQWSVSNTGTIVYPLNRAGLATMMTWRDRRGGNTPIAAPVHVYETPRISPDGTRIALHAIDGDSDIWIWDIRSETLTRLTFDKSLESAPVWTRDGKRIVYVSMRDGAPNLFWKPADGTGQPEALLREPPQSNGALVANGATPDGKSLIFSVGVPSDIMALPLEGERRPQTLIGQKMFAERSGDVSPDGRWIAYQSDESGVFQIYVRPYPAVDGGRWQVSGDGGALPRWAPNGRELFYVNSRRHLVSTAIEGGPTLTLGKTTDVLDFADSPPAVYRNYDVSPDGSRFVLITQPRTTSAPQFIVVENWFEELKQRVPTTR